MKKILRLIFEERMQDLENQSVDFNDRIMNHIERNHIAEKKLRELGYELEFVGGTMADSSVEVKVFEPSYWKLKKLAVKE